MGLKDPWWMKHCANAAALAALSEDPKKLRRAIKASRGFVLEKLVEAGLDPEPNVLAKMDLPACAMHLKTRRWEALTKASKAEVVKWLVDSSGEPRGSEEVKAAYFAGEPILEDEDLDPAWVAQAPEKVETMFESDEYSTRRILERMASQMSEEAFLTLPRSFLDQNAWLFSEKPGGIVGAAAKAAYLRALENDRSRAGKPTLRDFRRWVFEPGEKGLLEGVLAGMDAGRRPKWSEFAKLPGASKLFEPAEYVAVWAPTKLSGLDPEVLAANKKVLQEALAKAALGARSEWSVVFFMGVEATEEEFGAVCDEEFWEGLSARSFPSFSGSVWKEDAGARARLWSAAIGAAKAWTEGKAAGPEGGAPGGAVKGALGWAVRLDQMAESANEDGAPETAELCSKLADALFEGPVAEQLSTGHSTFWEALSDGPGYLESMAESERGRERVARFSERSPSGNWLWILEGARARTTARNGFMEIRKREALEWSAMACRERLDPEIVRETEAGRAGALAKAQGERVGRCGQEGWEGLFFRWSPERSPGCWPLLRRIEEAGGDLESRFEAAEMHAPEELVASWLSEGSAVGADKVLRAKARNPGLLSTGRLAALARDHEEAVRLGAADSGEEEAKLRAELEAAADEVAGLRGRVESGSRAARRHQKEWPKTVARIGEAAVKLSSKAVAESGAKMLSEEKWGAFVELRLCGRQKASERLDELFKRKVASMEPETLASELENRRSSFWEALNRFGGRSGGRGADKATLPPMDEAWKTRVGKALLARIRRSESLESEKVAKFFSEEESGFFKRFALENFPEALFGTTELYPQAGSAVQGKYSAEEVVAAFQAAERKGSWFDGDGIEGFLAAQIGGPGGLVRFKDLAEASRTVPTLHALLCAPAALEAAEPWKLWSEEDGRELTRIEAGSKLAGGVLDWKAVAEGVEEMLRRRRSGRRHEEWGRAVRWAAGAAGAEGRDGVWRGSISTEDSERLAAALMGGSSEELCSMGHVGAAAVDEIRVRSLALKAAERADWTRLAFPMEGIGAGAPRSLALSSGKGRAEAALDALAEALAAKGRVSGLEALEYWGRASMWAEKELSWRGEKYIESAAGFTEALRALGPKVRSLLERFELDAALGARTAPAPRRPGL